MKKENVDVIKFTETACNCKLYDFQKEIIKRVYSKSGVPLHLIIPRKR